ncbi:response regulator transcription factor [Algoriphagus zhangzhouensis]|uniref:DNA-binding response regulator, NarL/FixJ family, contains REC and HTH domains n=1 Tax=Algoriphagus zhangzhouensis TaxID=1073327 RepID=A0A1M7ZB10_9BACT|nr:response regulator transcription factor [Algoriphagus zhangzhouensis]TDY46946.1 LuxR family two component transcriptional regulator [Algoriphagus zhangzhouensis]SHO62095.1 DNA-binding response regulator, NarL/FixJ family, contains REC and HTH domains [Algoriphagus zhangzhouensis]
MSIKVAIAEDNSFLLKAVLEKLSFYPDVEVKFSGSNGQEFLEKLEKDPNVQVVLMDIEMPKMTGIEAVSKISQLYPQIKTIMLTVFDDDENIFRSIQAGANGYFLKEVDPPTLYQGILDTLDGGAAMTPSIALKTLKLLRNPPSFDEPKEEISLTKREIEILEQIAKGLNYNQIGENLFISPKTVRKHIENIYQKLQVHSKLEAVQKAVKNRIIEG